MDSILEMKFLIFLPGYVVIEIMKQIRLGEFMSQACEVDLIR